MAQQSTISRAINSADLAHRKFLPEGFQAVQRNFRINKGEELQTVAGFQILHVCARQCALLEHQRLQVADLIG